MIPSNDFEWLGLILFSITTPIFFWFLFWDIKRSKKQSKAKLPEHTIKT